MPARQNSAHETGFSSLDGSLNGLGQFEAAIAAIP
jgi:hypothetical protein